LIAIAYAAAMPLLLPCHAAAAAMMPAFALCHAAAIILPSGCCLRLAFDYFHMPYYARFSADFITPFSLPFHYAAISASIIFRFRHFRFLSPAFDYDAA
jgi:hypothetical protein